MIERIIELLKESEGLGVAKKKDIVASLKYMPEWQLEDLLASLVDLHEEELKFKSDVARLDMKYKMIAKKEIEKVEAEE